MSSGATAQDKSWKAKEQSDEARYAKEKEQEQLAALREQMAAQNNTTALNKGRDDIEGGYGGQEDLEDRYATTSGQH
ncbi:hypothetical protein BD410DRAFT_412070 [Rickenella mellea]|uniref:Uncharacterized protein n=1 Tax=Rickenella mellea TaxID=50990 RepID=A0A4Y7QI21_9AGAM|nr:hypothetical protein BD410DRAFT_412070 [Rickenella mellea]